MPRLVSLRSALLPLLFLFTSLLLLCITSVLVYYFFVLLDYFPLILPGSSEVGLQQVFYSAPLNKKVEGKK